jgi:hypothetical protein
MCLRIVLLLSLLFGSFGAAACDREPPNEAIPGVRLGMTPRDVRARFEDGAAGSWQTKVGGGAGVSDDTVLEWTTGGDPKSRATTVRFEFHLGMLVAVRAHLRETLAAERVDLTPKTVTVRTPGGGGMAAGTGGPGGRGTDVTILARDCPTHRQEAETLAAKAVK